MPCKIAIVGASTLVGREILKTLSERSFPLSQIRLFDTDSSVGHYIEFNNSDILIEELSEHALKEGHFKIVFFTGGNNLSKQYVSLVLETGAFVIDSSLYSNHNLKSPLIIPGINWSEVKDNKVVTSPFCLTVQLAHIFAPILKSTKINRVLASTYQSVSGSGYFGVEELERQITEIENGKEASLHYFSKQIAFNVIPQINEFEDSWTKEELLLEEELSMIFGEKGFDFSSTCVRVPVIRGHSASVMMELEDELSEDEIYYLWESFGIETYREFDDYPTPWELEGTYQLGVSRLRKDRHKKNCYHFWTVADNLLFCAALNNVLIAEKFLENSK